MKGILRTLTVFVVAGGLVFGACGWNGDVTAALDVAVAILLARFSVVHSASCADASRETKIRHTKLSVDITRFPGRRGDSHRICVPDYYILN